MIHLTPQKVLIICYYWPPAGGPGVQRWLKFATYFSQFGIEPIVYCPAQAHYPIVDQSLVANVPVGITVLQTPIKEPTRWAQKLFSRQTKDLSRGIITSGKKDWVERFLLFVRGHFFIPDARIGWVKPSVSFLSGYLQEHTDIKTIITTGPPHSLHLIGSALKQKLAINWIADFRDPWTQIHYHKDLNLSSWAAKKHQKLEQQVLTMADHIVVTSPLTKTHFKALTQQPISLVTNGYDPIDFPEASSASGHFDLVHTGTLLAERNPNVLWEALSELIKNTDFKAKAKVHLVGVVAPSIRSSIKRYGLEDIVELHGYVPHQEALQWVVDAQLLLLVEMNKETVKDIIPGKFFEYLGASAKTLAIGPEDGVIKELIESTQSGAYFGYHNVASIKDFIAEEFERYQNDVRPVKSFAAEYERKALTQKMAALVKSL